MSKAEENLPKLWRKHFPWPEADGNKYDRGVAVILGGSADKTGATKLAAISALRVGAGLVSVACDAKALPIYAASFQAIMTKPVANLAAFYTLIEDVRVQAVLIGPNVGVTARTKQAVMDALKLKKRMVLDADALSCFQNDRAQLFKAIQSPVILTPHEGEFSRLFGKLIPSTLSREKRALAAAKMSGAVTVLKGQETVIASPEGRLAINKNATPFLATAGAGDVLAGLCAGLLAQGMDPFEAASAAVWVHAEAASGFGPGLVADDLPGLVPAVLKGLRYR